MQKTSQTKLLEAIKQQVIDLLDSNSAEIIRTYEEAEKEADADKKFKFPLSFKSSITGVDPDTYEVDSQISYKINRKDSRDELVKVGQDLVDMANEAVMKAFDA